MAASSTSGSGSAGISFVACVSCPPSHPTSTSANNPRISVFMAFIFPPLPETSPLSFVKKRPQDSARLLSCRDQLDSARRANAPCATRIPSVPILLHPPDGSPTALPCFARDTADAHARSMKHASRDPGPRWAHPSTIWTVGAITPELAPPCACCRQTIRAQDLLLFDSTQPAPVLQQSSHPLCCPYHACAHEI